MNWEAIAAIGELIGAVAVVASLVFVGWQLLQNTEALRTSTSQSHGELYVSIANKMAGDRDLATLYLAGLADISSLDPPDRIRVMGFISSLFRYYEMSFVHHQKGKLDEELWTSIAHQLEDMAMSPGVHSWWKLRQHWHSRAFPGFFDSLIESRQGRELYGESAA